MRRCISALVIAISAGACADAQGRNIFDDDWEPPKKNQPAEAKPLTPAPAVPPKPVAPPKIAPVTPTPVTPNPVTPPKVVVIPMPEKRRAIPGAAEQGAVRKIMKSLYAKELADHSPAGRRKLAATLLDLAERTTDAPVDQFVLLAAAEDAAIEALDLPLAFTAAERMSRFFEVDGVDLKVEAATVVGPKCSQPSAAPGNVQVVLDLVEQLASMEDFATAGKLCQTVLTSAPNMTARAQVAARQKELALARETHARVNKDLATLKTSPDDAAANLSVGRYLCFSKTNWAAGLPLLAKGSDPALKAVAAQELAKPGAADALIALADGWWDISAKQTDSVARWAIQTHAAEIYGGVVSKTVGLRRQQIEKRMTMASNAVKGTTGPQDVMANMEGGRREVQGVFLKRGEKLVSTESFKPPVAFKMMAQIESQDMRIGYAAQQIIFAWGGGTELRIDGGPATGKHKKGAGGVPAKAWFTIDLIVKTDSMTILVNGQERQFVQADFSKVDQKLSITAFGSAAVVKSVQLTRD